MKITHQISLIILLLVFASCEKLIEIELPEDSKKLVVEAELSTEKEFWTIVLSRTQSFNDQTGPQHVTDALVIISDDHGNADTLSYSEEGAYKSEGLRQCIPGLVYTLTIYDGTDTYTAVEKCHEQYTIDTLLSFYIEESNLFREKGWYAFEVADEWEEPGDYYLWKVYRNDTLLKDNGYLTDGDETMEMGYFNEGLDPENPYGSSEYGRFPNSFPYKFNPGDSVRIEQYNIGKGFHHYLNEVQKQRNRGGTPFDAPPTNPVSNMSGGALGYFSVVNVVSAETVIPQ